MTEEGLGAKNFDRLCDLEEKKYKALTKHLGESLDLFNDLISLYSLFIQLCVKPVRDLGQGHQISALLYALQWMRNEAAAGTLTLLRGHITDSNFYTRRTLEITAVIVLMYRDETAAKRWVEAGNSNNARKRYTESFQAFKLVRELLSPELVELYEMDCLNVHPSPFAVIKRVSLTDDGMPSFSLFDLDETDPQHTFFVSTYLGNISSHAKMLEFLSLMFAQSENFDLKEWKSACRLFGSKYRAQHQKWNPIFEARIQSYDHPTS